MRIDERMLHYLSGVAAIDERLDGIAEPMQAPADESDVPRWAAQVASLFAAGADCVQLQGAGTPPGREEVLQLLAAGARSGLWIAALPEDPAALAQTLRLVDREAALMPALVVLDLRTSGTRLDHVQPLLRSPLLVLAQADAGRAVLPDVRCRIVSLPAATPESRAEDLARRAQRCGALLPVESLQAAVADACEQFAPGRRGALDDAARQLADAMDPESVHQIAWTALREHSREGLDQLAQRIDSTTTLDDLVLPAAQASLLANIGRQLQHRRRVYRDWGFAGRGARGLGIAALFAGESGTGKTMAAEIIGHSLGLDVYKVDLSAVVNKYIGETEKNLERIFSEAQGSDAVLFFDEADALFGKRSEVKDAHDRYANIETAYLLQRTEEYNGLVILATNLKKNMDEAFIRRLHFTVEFPFPEEAERLEIWRRTFPPEVPRLDDIDLPFLARKLRVTGGNIRNIILTAAFLAAEDGAPLGMRHLIRAAGHEYQKMGKLVVESDFEQYYAQARV
ncbi:MAG: ATP-binding protein [Luteimonas sp.]|nr:ATP-binding protein [Luteimonas sp.]